MIARCAFAALAAALVCTAAGCGKHGGISPVDDGLGVVLGMDPADCGLTEDVPDAAALDGADTTAGQVDALVPIVEDARGLELRRPVEPTLLERSAFERRLQLDWLEEYPPAEAETDRRALELLGAVPDGYPLRTELGAELPRGLAGVYFTEENEIVVARTQGGRLDELELEVVAHELVHAAQDATFGDEDGRASDSWGDSHLALAALLEGDALLVELRLVAAIESERARRELLYGVPADLIFGVSAELPHVLDSSFEFPYREGLGFVCALYRGGGWKAVDAAHDRLPQTTAEILFPERYLARERAAVPRPSTAPGRGWTRAVQSSGDFGAADLVALFEAPGGSLRRALDDPVGRAAGWNGGRIDLWVRGGASALAVALVQRERERSLCRSLRDWYAASFPKSRAVRRGAGATFTGSGRTTVLTCSGAEVRLGIAPDRATAELLSTPAA